LSEFLVKTVPCLQTLSNETLDMLVEALSRDA